MVALAGIFGGQLFNLLVGMGASLMYQTISQGGKVKFDLFKKGESVA